MEDALALIRLNNPFIEYFEVRAFNILHTTIALVINLGTLYALVSIFFLNPSHSTNIYNFELLLSYLASVMCSIQQINFIVNIFILTTPFIYCNFRKGHQTSNILFYDLKNEYHSPSVTHLISLMVWIQCKNVFKT